MFIRKAEYEELKRENMKLSSENKILRFKLDKTQEERDDFKTSLEDEQQENYRQHKKLLAIERALDSVYESYNNILKVINKIRNIIKNNELADANQTNSN